ncbi:MAG: hypothetical protein WDO73_28935 [Ignavibacteriota bacterium]
MSKKWYNLFVSVDESSSRPEESEATPPAHSAADAIADIARGVTPLDLHPRSQRPSATLLPSPRSTRRLRFIHPAHGFTIEKVGDMLRSEHIRNLPRDVKKSSVLVALEAVGAPIQDVIQDAMKRDQALDTFESVQERALNQLEAQKVQENQEIQAEIDRLLADRKAKMQANTDAIAKEKERFFAWRLKKQEEEQKIADAVSYFVTDNPITGGHAAPPAPAPKSE